MAEKYGLSEAQFQLIQKQAARRAEMRRIYMKQKTNPWKHAAEAGHVFDPALQRFMAMKVTQFEVFKPNRSNALFGIFSIIVPMVTYGYFIWNFRNDRELKIRSGELRYQDRVFRLC